MKKIAMMESVRYMFNYVVNVLRMYNEGRINCPV